MVDPLPNKTFGLLTQKLLEDGIENVAQMSEIETETVEKNDEK